MNKFTLRELAEDYFGDPNIENQRKILVISQKKDLPIYVDLSLADYDELEVFSLLDDSGLALKPENITKSLVKNFEYYKEVKHLVMYDGLQFINRQDPYKLLPHQYKNLIQGLNENSSLNYLKNLCFWTESKNCFCRIKEPRPGMVLMAEESDEFKPQLLQLDKILNAAVSENWIERLRDPSQPRKWKFLLADNFLYALLCVMLEREYIYDKNAFIRQFVSRKERPFERCRRRPQEPTMKTDYYQIASEFINSVA